MSSLLDRIERGFNALNQAVAVLVAVSIGLFAALVPLDLFLRKLRWGNLEWLNEGAEYAFFVGVFMSAAWVLNKGAHVRVDIVIASLSPRMALRLERVMDLLGALLCATLCYFGTLGMLLELEYGTLPDKDLRIPNWYMLMFFAISFALLTIEFLFRFRRAGKEGHEASSDTGF